MAEPTTSKKLSYNQKLAMGFGGVAALVGLYWLVKPKAAAASSADKAKDKGTAIIVLPPEKTLANGGATRLVDGPIVQPFYVVGDSGAAAFMKAMPALVGNAMPGTGYDVIANAIINAKNLIPTGTKTALVFLGSDVDINKPDATQTQITAAVQGIQKAISAAGARTIFIVPNGPYNERFRDLLRGVLNQNAEYIVERPGEEETFDLVKSALGLAPGQAKEGTGPVNLRVKRILTYTDAAHLTQDDGPIKQQDGSDTVLPDATNVDAALHTIYKFYSDSGMTRFSVYGANAATGQIVDQITTPDWPTDVPS